MTRPIRRLALAVPLAALLAAWGPKPFASPPVLLEIAGSCAHAASVAAQQGGQVIGSPRLVNRNGQQVCVVTVLIQKPGSPPVRRQIEVPAR